MAVRFSGNKYSSISFPPRKRAQGVQTGRDRDNETESRHVLFHRLRGEVDARHSAGAEILRPPRLELAGVRITAAGVPEAPWR